MTISNETNMNTAQPEGVEWVNSSESGVSDSEVHTIVQDLTDPEDVFSPMKDKLGRFRTASLFWESRTGDYPCFFTLKPYDHKGCISLYRKYMEIGDPTEYRFALGCFGSWKHWQVLTKLQWFQPHHEEWKKELELKLISDQYDRMEDIAKTAPKGSPSHIAAVKWLAEFNQPKKRGRPSKAERAQLLKEERIAKTTVNEDAQLLGLN